MAEERVQRRLAAIVSADVVGYSAMMGRDEAGTLARLKALRQEFLHPKVAEYGGRIVKTTGDGTLIEFPSAVDAVQHAIDVQRGLAERNADCPEDERIRLRLGINVGDIIIDGDDIYGDGVNVAARLEGLCGSGEVYVSGTVFDQAAGKLSASFENLGERQVKNIEKPVRVYRVAVEAELPANPGSRRLASPPSFPEGPSIAVLPFVNISSDPEQEYFADGISEDLITDLSKISGLFVVARNTSFAIKGEAHDVKDVGQRFGVRHVLEGSVRRAGNRIRINAQLVDATTGGQLWAERYDGEIEDIFALQDDISAKIISGLRVHLTPIDRQKVGRKATLNAEAYDLFLKGRADFYGYSPARVADAIRRLEQAIELDPNYADAYGYLSYCRTTAHMFAWPGADETLDAAIALARKSVALDDGSALAHTRLGWVQGCLARFDEASASFETAIALDPRNAEAFYAFGEMLNHAGRPEKALPMLAKAYDIETIVPPSWPYSEGHALNLMGRFDAALGKIGPVIERARFFVPGRIQMARALAETGQWADAQKQIEAMLEQSPDFRVENAETMFPYPDAQEHFFRLGEILRTAGLPE